MQCSSLPIEDDDSDENDSSNTSEPVPKHQRQTTVTSKEQKKWEREQSKYHDKYSTPSDSEAADVLAECHQSSDGHTTDEGDESEGELFLLHAAIPFLCSEIVISIVSFKREIKIKLTTKIQN
jgi:RNA polymerase-interacting CarD/CdnL/TRCF family regulator